MSLRELIKPEPETGLNLRSLYNLFPLLQLNLVRLKIHEGVTVLCVKEVVTHFI